MSNSKKKKSRLQLVYAAIASEIQGLQNNLSCTLNEAVCKDRRSFFLIFFLKAASTGGLSQGLAPEVPSAAATSAARCTATASGAARLISIYTMHR